MSTVAFVAGILGIASTLLSFQWSRRLFVFSILFSVLALVLGVLGRREPTVPNLARAAFVLALIGIALWLALFLWRVALAP